MAKKPKDQDTLIKAVEDALARLLQDTISDPEASLTDKCKVIDRVLNCAKIKLKMADDEFGAGFFGGDDED